MASTKQMQERAKAKKQDNEPNLNESNTLSLLEKVATLLEKHNPEQDYNQTQISRETASTVIDHYGLKHKHLNQLMVFREKFEQGLTKKYSVKLATGLSAFTQDQEQTLKQHNVPQNVRVISGLLDTLIYTLAFKCGAVKIHAL